MRMLGLATVIGIWLGVDGLTLVATAAQGRQVDALRDNSFLIEEAYNQEAGVVQHILTWRQEVNHLPGGTDRDWQLAFTQEWPLGSERHQASYTLPYARLDAGEGAVSGFGDVVLSYRVRMVEESSSRPTITFRAGVVLPSGSSRRGLGEGAVGYELNLPVSKALSDRWAVHANLGVSGVPSQEGRDPTTLHFGGSAIYALRRDWHVLVEGLARWSERSTGFRAVDRWSETVISPGFRYAFSGRSSQWVVGIGVPIGLQRRAPDYGLLLYLSLEHPFRRPPTPRPEEP